MRNPSTRRTTMALSDTVSGFPDYAEIIMKAIEQPMILRNGVRITDLTLCPRQKVFEIVNPKNQPHQTIVRTAAGQGLHRLIQKRLKESDPDAYEIEMPVEYKNFVYGSIDVYDKRCDVIIDIKEKIVNGYWEERPYSSQEEQLRNLMAMNNTSRGVIILVLLNKATIKKFEYFMTEEQKKRQLMKLDENASSFLTAKNSRDPGLAKHVFLDGNLKWLCHRLDKKNGAHIWCPYFLQCATIIAAAEEKRKEDERHDNEDEDDGEGYP